jgi:hypothetical protein
MGTVQTSYVVDKVLGYPGTVADSVDTVRESKAAAAAVNFGTFVCRRASPADAVEQCANPAATADVTARGRGIALRDETRKNTQGYVTDDQVVYLRKGRVIVAVEAAVTQDAAVFVRFAAGTGTQLGAFRGDADTATAVALPGAIFKTSTAGAGLAIVEINLPT